MTKTCVRKESPLRELIKICCEAGSINRTYEWSGCRRMQDKGFIYRIVNHSKLFFDLTTKIHTRGIEKRWSRLNQ